MCITLNSEKKKEFQNENNLNRVKELIHIECYIKELFNNDDDDKNLNSDKKKLNSINKPQIPFFSSFQSLITEKPNNPYICLQLIHNIFEQYINYYLLQQMNSKECNLTIRELLSRIDRLLRQGALARDTDARSLQTQLKALTEQLRSPHLARENMLTLLIADSFFEQQVSQALWKALLVVKEESVLLSYWKELKQQVRQNYIINQSSLNTLTKEVLENIKLITEELEHLSHNLTALQTSLDSSESIPPIPLYFLMRMAMDDTQVSFSNEMNELLFRLYILEESTRLVLLKAFRVAEQLFQRFCDDGQSRRSSMNSEKTGKRSALSESLQVFKRNQLRQELQRSDLLLPAHQSSQIQSDYRMTGRRIERGKVDAGSTCCFRF